MHELISQIKAINLRLGLFGVTSKKGSIIDSPSLIVREN